MKEFDHIAAFESTVQKTYEWLQELEAEMGMQNRRRAYDILRAYLQALRDLLPSDEMAQLAAQLPMLLRGIYFEGWDPSRTPVRPEPEDLLQRVTREANLVGPGEARGAVRAATQVLGRHVSSGEVEQVLHTLPQRLQRLLV
jgi:uncharacterized protein (DUF2267 family)